MLEVRKMVAVVGVLLTVLGVVSTVPVVAQSGVVLRPDVASGPSGEVIRVAVFDNDSALPPGAAAELLILPVNGTALLVDGGVDYTPNVGFGGVDSFSYRVCLPGVDCVSTTVRVFVGAAGCTIVGTDGPDVLQGGTRGGVICGLGGDDVITIGRGTTVVFAGGGNDTVTGGTGTDTIHGGPGDDQITAGRGSDEVHGGDGDDSLFGDDGTDLLIGGAGDDRIDGGAGSDSAVGGDGADVVRGSGGADSVSGGDGPDVVFGDGGDDLLAGGAGDDNIDGGTDIDSTDGGPGVDVCRGSETTVSCGEAASGVLQAEVVEIIDLPAAEREPFGFRVTEPELGVDLAVESLGDVFAFDVFVDLAVYGDGVDPVRASNVVDLQLHPGAPPIGGAQLALSYDEALLAGADEAGLRIWTFDEPTADWQIVPGEQTVDTDTNQVTARLEHFSCYAVLTAAPSQTPADPAVACAGSGRVNYSTRFLDGSLISLPTSTLIQPSGYATDGDGPVVPSIEELQRLNDGTVAVTRTTFDRVIWVDDQGHVDPALPCGQECQIVTEFLAGDASQLMATQRVFDQTPTAAAAARDPAAAAAAGNRPPLQSGVVQAWVEWACTTQGSKRIDCSKWADTAQGGDAGGFVTPDGTFIAGEFGSLPGLDIWYRGFEPIDVTSGALSFLVANDNTIVSSSAVLRMYGSHSVDGRFCGLLYCQVGQLNVSPQSLADSRRWAGLTARAHTEREVLFAEFPGLNWGALAAQATNGDLSDALVDDLEWFDQNQDRLLAAGYPWIVGDRYSQEAAVTAPDGADTIGAVTARYFQITAIRLSGFEGDAGLAAGLLFSMPSVFFEQEGGERVYWATEASDARPHDLRTFTGFEKVLQRWFTQVLTTVATGDRGRQVEAVALLPETYSGYRNRLITAMYYELGHTIQAWTMGVPVPMWESDGDRTLEHSVPAQLSQYVVAADDRPATWGSVAGWGSEGVGVAIRGDLDWTIDLGGVLLPGDVHDARQAAANGNQWIFGDALRHYAHLMEFVATNPNPTVAEWEAYFADADHWRPGDRVARDAMLALVASRYATDPAEQQRLMFNHVAGFGNLEQQGAQYQLDSLRPPLLPDWAMGIYLNVQMGSTKLNVDADLEEVYVRGRDQELGDLGSDVRPVFPASDNVEDLGVRHNLDFWNSPLSDPSLAYDSVDELSGVFDADLDFEFHASLTAGAPEVIDVRALGSYPEDRSGWGTHDQAYTPYWEDWADGAGRDAGEPFSGTGVLQWADWEERMWYLMNMFRVSIMDPLVKQPPHTEKPESEREWSSFRSREQDYRDVYDDQTISKLMIDQWDLAAPSITQPQVSALGVTWQFVPAPVRTSTPTTVTVTVENRSSEAVANPSLTLSLPPQFTGVEAVQTCVAQPLAFSFTCLLGTVLGPDASASRSFTFTAPDGFNLDGAGLPYRADGPGIAPAVGTIPLDQAVATNLLRVQATLTPDPVVAGRLASTEFAVSNIGTTPVVDARLAVRLADGFDSVIAPAGCTTVTVTEYQCTLGDIAAGGSVTRLFRFDVPPGFAPSSVVLTYGVGEGSATAGDPNGPTAGAPTGGIVGGTVPGAPSDYWCVDGCLFGGSVGDPHLRTFDGGSYDLQTIGEHVWLASDDGSVLIQNRTARWRTTAASVNTAIAARINNRTVELRAGGVLLVDGAPVSVDTAGWVDLGNGAAVIRSGGNWRLVWPGTGPRPALAVRAAAGYLDLSFRSPDTWTGGFSGLLGDGDGNPVNDYQLRDGTILPLPLTTATLYGPYATSWRITNAESLFTYPAGEGTGDYTDLAFPFGGPPTLDAFDPVQVEAARRHCRLAGVQDPDLVDDCALDLLVSGDDSFLASYLGLVLPAGVGDLHTVRQADGAPVLVPGVQSMAVTDDGGVAYLTIPTQGRVAAVDLLTGAVTDHAAGLTDPGPVTVGPDGAVYVGVTDPANPAADAIVRIGPDGTPTQIGQGLGVVGGIAVSSIGTVYALSTVEIYTSVVIVTPQGNTIATGAGSPATATSGLTIDDQDRVWWFGWPCSTCGAKLLSWAGPGSTVVAHNNVSNGHYYSPEHGSMFRIQRDGLFTHECNGQWNTTQIFWTDATDLTNPQAAQKIVGGSDGFNDATLTYPHGRICSTQTIQLTGNTLWTFDHGNNAIRYLAINRP